MDERRLKYLYTALAVVFGLPSLAMGGMVAAMFLLLGLQSFGRNSDPNLVLLSWGLAGVAGCPAWLWLSAGYLLQGRAGLQVRTMWWWLLLMGGLAALPVLGLAAWAGFQEGHTALELLLLGPSMLVPAAMLVWLKRRA
ncbi:MULTISPECIES: hypothetical protein [Stenotrophomonas]|uniref:Transmembrane protein n=1 Tax=Stenotrophomonas maltophilia TaxID=40324 RepID=A0A2J0UHQ3_STEMA|nr:MULTISPECIES: hypothetical protein [Stenotrophomonas]PJL34366.1 hypothetical protein B9Y64_04635 [Stenotrophomonas maltophilia]HDS1145690.1 hypothetical protein [Stenotrophomonas maltophilia]HDS1160424.1 hypothetical protein [Stenotrophomonas maltophilia]